MSRISLLIALSALLVSSAHAAPGLPGDFDPDPDIPAPAGHLGFEPGSRHPRADQVTAYLNALAEASDRVRLETIGRTHGGRDLVLAYFADPERLDGLDALRDGRHAASLAGEGPPVIWLGYSVHGNEASGASAAMLTAWYLASARNPEVEDWLSAMAIVMQPVINPDGLDRFAHWANMHRGRHPSADPFDREHNEAWPGGRGNYYWFDLNRDWVPLVHPESRSRLRHYHRWRPHLLIDVHEMGHEASYFFQPGVSERQNPLIPDTNRELTARIAAFYGRALDAAGEPHFTREWYDDFFPGKGSTYPDLTGGVGILFEQGSARGHVMDTPWGRRSFTDAIANQVRTSLATLRAGYALGEELPAYQARFFDTARDDVRRDRRAGWVLGDGGDPARAAALVELLLAHDVEVRPLQSEIRIAGNAYGPGTGWVIPAAQDPYLLLKSMLEPVIELPMETFYDVSAWPLGMAFDLPLESVARLPDAGEPLERAPETAGRFPDSEITPAAWLVPWNQLGAPAALAALLDGGYRVQAAMKPLTVDSGRGARELVRGSLIIQPGIQDKAAAAGRLRELSAEHGIEVLAAPRGLSLEGIDLGSPSAPVLEPITPALLTGHGINPGHAGAVWHWFDTRLNRPLTRLDWLVLSNEEVDDYTHLILPDGEYKHMPEWVRDWIVGFVERGGVLIAARAAAAWVEELDLDWQLQSGTAGPETVEPGERRPYADFTADFERRMIGGSALRVDLDITHPLGFGYEQNDVIVFRRGNHALRATANPYTRAAVYADDPLAAGYLAEDNRRKLAGAPALDATRHGPGLVIRMADDYLFRGYWRGTERLFANALFFSGLIEPTELEPAE